MNLKQLNKKVKDLGLTNKEITWFHREYYVLHILHNDRPVTLFHSKDSQEISDYLETLSKN